MLDTIAITTQDRLRLHHQLRPTPYAANRTIAVASALFNWAARAGLRAPGPHVNPRDDVPKYREHPRHRYLTAQELKRVGCALRVAERRRALAPTAVLAIRLLMLTGARVSEILSLRKKVRLMFVLTIQRPSDACPVRRTRVIAFATASDGSLRVVALPVAVTP